jgi:Cu(I)/Ag(I) efflux system membrane protein CusA/SilA
MTPGHGLIERIIAFCARRRVPTLIGVAIAFAAGLVALSRTSLDAIPDLSDTQVIVATEWAGKSPDLIEDQVTYPIVTTLRAAPGVRYVRGYSMLGDSFVYVVFKDGVDLYWARSRVLELLAQVQSRLPEGAVPRLGPDATGVGWVYQYALVDTSGAHDLSELRALQDWTVRYQLQAVEGVAEVASVGGFVRRYEVVLDPARLASYGVTIGQVKEALARTSQDSGAGVLEVAEHEVIVRGRGYVTTLADVASTPVRAGASGVPITIAQLGAVRMGPEPRRGIATLDDRGEVVGGIVVMRQGQNALSVIHRVKARLAEVARTLPPGVRLVTTYDRSTLIEDAVGTLTSRLVEEMVIVSLVILLFLFHVRSALIPILSLPVAVVLAFLPMHLQGLNANLMSLGGIAVAIGAMVDASIIMIENVHKRLEDWEASGRAEAREAVIVRALQEVGRPVFFALLVIAVSFLPVFTLEAQEGRLFRPLAFTKTWAMTFAALLAVTLTPALAMLMVRGKIRPERDQPVARFFIRVYTPVLRWTVARRRFVIAAATLVVLSTIPVFLSLGVEFMPPLNEGVLLYMPTAPPGMSDSEASAVLQKMGRLLEDVPEVERVFGKIGRARTATDPAPPGMVETVIALKPARAWRKGMTWEKLVSELDQRLRIPGMPNLWWFPIQTRNEMLATGVRSAVAIKVFGPDLATIERLSLEIEQAVRGVPGVRSAYAERLTGATYFDVTVRREDAARYGLTVADVEDAVEAAAGGAIAGSTVEGRARYAIAVRYAPELGDTPEALARVLVATPTGAQVPLEQVATLGFAPGPPMIQDEDGQLVGLVSLDVAGRSLDRVVRDTKARVEERVRLAPGTRLEWAGQFQHLVRAERRLLFVVPLTLLLVCLLLWLNLRSWPETAIVLLAVPFSLVGAVWLVWLLGFNMSVAVWVGMIALAGLDAETGTLMLLYLNLAYRERVAKGRLRTRGDLAEAIVEGAAHRIRPKHMTVFAILLGLLPILWGHGAGSDVMQRIAAPMVGGVVSSFLLELLVYPAVFAWWKGRRLPEGAAT